MLSEIKVQLLLSHQLQENVQNWKHSENNDLKKDYLNFESTTLFSRSSKVILKDIHSFNDISIEI
jgi:hypothetical protein